MVPRRQSGAGLGPVLELSAEQLPNAELGASVLGGVVSRNAEFPGLLCDREGTAKGGTLLSGTV